MRAASSKSLIFEIYGAFVRQAGGWIAIADLVVLMADLGVEEQAVRSTVSRMRADGLLQRREIDRQVGYALTPRSEEILEEGDLRIFRGLEPAPLSDGWVLCVFSVPEDQRSRRHQLRQELAWLGFGALGGGVWIAPRRTAARAREVLRRRELDEFVDLFEGTYGGFDDQSSLVRRAWDLDALGGRYTEIVKIAKPILRYWRSSAKTDGRRAFRDYMAVLHPWRKMPYLDPGLPSEVLPVHWEGAAAAEMFSQVVELLEKPAARYVEGVLTARAE